ncbi:uncharacterized protein LACBIDRAFT_314777 [Laccaria bicolor S238N-H82]|uniref:Predicted protein n=1 Tax=Laccaria bicolor (strain S238N-H82 / ATCC MYA-4686) TaxID=486041 RepID=B0DL56_LACBS|nr:uncharacterized protein LACBIDRAFT_304190 [Laccaria bicolor S238N-H82]XP_001891307.1 uncharacterized protein LACBIDRAFT_314777 [Laccaria bicolor S238N-H82]EDQ98042.1 predicted protein [Laccaria bicolor S238N-H82]EDR04851.1 predicted protein [Laccaria bicolor S238N-H82]|eukprot:XP_001884675.1 predicted protein [Laccaria bicolor S238N-H82]
MIRPIHVWPCVAKASDDEWPLAFNATLDALDTFPGTSPHYSQCQQVHCARCLPILRSSSSTFSPLANSSVKSRNEFSHKL